jgi:putative ABC transport system permease protein
MMSVLRMLRLRLRAIFQRDALNREVEEELLLHIDLQTEENIRAGVSPEEARRRAVLLFGGIEGHKEGSRRAQGLELMGAAASWLDLKLGFRMLVKYPGLTLVGLLALTVGTGIGAAFFQFSENMFDPRLPFDESNRLVTVDMRDAETRGLETRMLNDYVRWRVELRSIDHLTVLRSMDPTVSTEAGYSETLSAAQVSPSMFELLRVQPMLGRPLVEDDARPDAAPVALISREVWERVFGGDPRTLGAEVRVGATHATIVGVMPEGFGFPVNQHVWMPFRTDLLKQAPLEGPGIRIVGRLHDGFGLKQARAELAALGARAATDSPETHKRLRPRVMTLAGAIGDDDMKWAIYGIRFFFVILMIILCVNVATLVFARTASRENEFAVRAALGASRRRIVLQLFMEALALTLVAAVLGLTAAYFGLRSGMELFWRVQEEAGGPYWWSDALLPETIAYGIGLALVGAAMVGVVPALKVTGKRVQPTLAQMSAGSPRLRFGGIWTVIVVIQVALSVAFLPSAVLAAKWSLDDAERDTGFAADSYLVGEVSRELEIPLSDLSGAERARAIARSAELHDEVERRVSAQPGVAGITFANRLSGMNHGLERIYMAENPVSDPTDTTSVSRTLSVDPNFFEVMGAPMLSGRGFSQGDVKSDLAVIVNRSFVEVVMGGQDPIGHRIRYPHRPDADADRWYEIVGVVDDIPMDGFGPGAHRAVYHPLRPGEAQSAQMFVLGGTRASALGPGIRSTINAIDPSLRLGELRTVREVWAPAHRSNVFFAAMQGLIAAVALLLSMAGIHALMAFTVSQRRREIGVRAALGARPVRIVAAIFSRAFLQLGLGVLIGAVFAAAVMGDYLIEEGPWIILGVVATMLGVGLLACYFPARRALRIQPTEALKGA